jgi:hypothetical protein
VASREHRGREGVSPTHDRECARSAWDGPSRPRSLAARPGFLLAAAGLVGGIAVFLAPETARRPMPAAPPVAASEQEAPAIRHG